MEEITGYNRKKQFLKFESDLQSAEIMKKVDEDRKRLNIRIVCYFGC